MTTVPLRLRAVVVAALFAASVLVALPAPAAASQPVGINTPRDPNSGLPTGQVTVPHDVLSGLPRAAR